MKRPTGPDICAKECGAYCCRNSVWTMDTTEMRRIRALPKGEKLRVFGAGINRWQVEMAYQPDHKCPFLTDDNLCSIHDKRPISCRRFPERPETGCLAWPLEEEEIGNSDTDSPTE